MTDIDFDELIKQEEREHKERVRRLRDQQKEYAANTARLAAIRSQMGDLYAEYKGLYESVKKTSRRRADEMEAAGFPAPASLLTELRGGGNTAKDPTAATAGGAARPAAETPAGDNGDVQPAPSVDGDKPSGDEHHEWEQPAPSNGDGWNG